MAKPNVLIIGDVMIDNYLWGDINRISPEAPVPVVDINKETSVLGGAGNVANNLISLGSLATIISVIGEDENSPKIIKMFDDNKIEHFLIVDKDRKTTKKTRIIASRQQVVRCDVESKNDISNEIEDKLLKKYEVVLNDFDIVLLSDYGKGVLTSKVVKKIIETANKNGKKVLVDPKGNDYSKYENAYLLTPNKKEAIEATGVCIKNNSENLIDALKKMKDIAKIDVPLITLSEDGIAFFDENFNLVIKPTVTREIYDVTGAGDTVLASLAIYLAASDDIHKAVEFANLAASIVIAKIGSSTATMSEIEEYESSLHKSDAKSHVKSFEEIKKITSDLKKQNKKIVFTNGCFDILHKGHASYLSKAKSFGDILILGLNTDKSVKRIKGETRPINNEDNRAFILASLESVDYVVKFEQDTPYSLISIIKPDILVKGGDYEGKEVVGSDIAKEVKLVQFIDGNSTTKTIAKIKKG